MTEVTVAIGTYGHRRWHLLAQTRAAPSAYALGVPVVHEHGPSLHAARNAALDRVRTEHVVHLDADDELDAGYFDALDTSTADIRVPAVRYVHPDRAEDPRMPRVAGHTHDCVAACLTEGNWCVIGSAVRTDLVREVGGWLAEPFWEDWSVFLRCHLAGATFEAVPGAVYRAHRVATSRNWGQHTAAERRRAYNQIRRTAGIAESQPEREPRD